MGTSENFVDVAGFFNQNVPFCLRGDVYTVCGETIASPEARARSVYNLTNRRSPAVAWPGVALDSRMVFYGLSHWVRECLRPGSVRSADNGIAHEFMGRTHAFGGRLNFNRYLWDSVEEEFGGNLPVKIEALPEGSVFWPNEPVVQVTSLGTGFGEVAALIEATLLGMVSCATARATLTRHLLGRMREEVKIDNPHLRSFDEVQAVAEFMVHDFGMRASSTPLEAEVFGTAHLLSFRGTDTTPAAFSAWLYTDADKDLGDVGTSILAHAHRIILGYDDEGEAVRALADASERCGDVAVASYLADTFDFANFLDNLALPLALEFKRRGQGGCVVVRTDSGDPVENVSRIVKTALSNGLYCDPFHYGQPRATHMRFMSGDSMDYAKIAATLRHLRSDLGVSATSWGGFGVGGWLRREATRDALSSAYKLASKGLDGTPVVKLSETRAKMSVPGEVDVYRFPADPARPTVYPRGTSLPHKPAYVTYYDGSLPGDSAYGGTLFENFMDKRGRSVVGFHAQRFAPPDKGGEGHPVLCEAIRSQQSAVMEKYGRNPSRG